MLLLLLADRKTGELTIGRQQIAQQLRITQSSVYRALCRLQTEQRIVMKPNNKWTAVSILNWDKYQSNRTTNEQQTNTLQEVRSKKKKEYIESFNKNKQKLLESKSL